MNDVAKIIEISASSPTSMEAAVQAGLDKVSRSISHIQGAWISETKVVTAPDGTIREWRVCMRVTFLVE